MMSLNKHGVKREREEREGKTGARDGGGAPFPIFGRQMKKKEATKTENPPVESRWDSGENQPESYSEEERLEKSLVLASRNTSLQVPIRSSCGRGKGGMGLGR